MTQTIDLALRPYQETSTQEIFRHWAQGKNSVLLTSPTGSGKTVVFCHIARMFLSSKQQVLIIAHRTELISQTVAKLKALTNDEEIGIIKAKVKPNPQALIQVASIQTLVRRKYPSAALVVFDEAHHCKSKSYTQIFRHYSQQGAYVLGVTATPCTSDGKRGLGKLYNNCSGFEALVQTTSVKELIEAKYLADFSLFAPQKILNASEAKIRVVAGDYNQRDVAQFVEENLVIGDSIKTWQRHAQGKRTVIFAVSVKHSKLLAKEFRQAGISAAHLDGNSKPSYRQKVLKSFALGKILVLCQHSLVTEGLDIQGIEAIQFLRPTKSIVLWWQAIGRALRFALNKKAIIIDHTDSHRHLPWPNQKISWQLDKLQPIKQKPTGKCPDCGRLLQISTDLLQKTRPYLYCIECDSRLEILNSQKNKKNSTIKLIKVIEAEFAQITADTIPTQAQPEIQPINHWTLDSFDADQDRLNASGTSQVRRASHPDVFSTMQDLFTCSKTPSTSQGKVKPYHQHIPNNCDLPLKLKEIIGQQRYKQYKPGWTYYQILEDTQLRISLTEKQWLSLAKELNYRPGWAKIVYDLAQEYKQINY